MQKALFGFLLLFVFFVECKTSGKPSDRFFVDRILAIESKIYKSYKKRQNFSEVSALYKDINHFISERQFPELYYDKIYFFKSVIELSLGNFSGALLDVKYALDVNPYDLSGYIFQYQILRSFYPAEPQYVSSLEVVLDKMISLSPDDVLNRFLKTDLLLYTGQYKRAATVCDVLKSSVPLDHYLNKKISVQSRFITSVISNSLSFFDKPGDSEVSVSLPGFFITGRQVHHLHKFFKRQKKNSPLIKNAGEIIKETNEPVTIGQILTSLYPQSSDSFLFSRSHDSEKIDDKMFFSFPGSEVSLCSLYDFLLIYYDAYHTVGN